MLHLSAQGLRGRSCIADAASARLVARWTLRRSPVSMIAGERPDPAMTKHRRGRSGDRRVRGATWFARGGQNPQKMSGDVP